MPCSPRMQGCAASCLHRRLVEDYQLARHAAELAREYETRGHKTETAEYGPILTFQEWLIHSAQPGRQRNAA